MLEAFATISVYVDIFGIFLRVLGSELAVDTSFVLLLEVKPLEFTTAFLSCSKIHNCLFALSTCFRLFVVEERLFSKLLLVIFFFEFESHRLRPPADPCIENPSIYYGYSSSSLAQQSSTSSPSQH